MNYTVTATDIAAGRDHVIFRYSNEGNSWNQTNEVNFSVDPKPSGWDWTNPGGGSWATAGNWTPAGPANGADQAGLFTGLDITGEVTVSLDGNYTIGKLFFADVGGTDGSWNLEPGTGGTLTLSAPIGGEPGISVTTPFATVSAILAGTEGLIKTGNGTLVLGGANTYSGDTVIKGGPLRVDIPAAIPSGAGKGNVTVSSSLDLSGHSVTLNGLNGSGTVTTSGIGSPVLTLGAGDASGSFSGVINNGSGTINLVKTGTGTQTLTANNTFSGGITVDGGSLVARGQLRNIAGLIVNDGATIEIGTTNMFVGGHGIAMNDARVLIADGGTILMNANMDSRIGNVTLLNGATWTINRPLTAWDVLLADTTAGPATVTVANTGGNTESVTIDGSGGLHLGGVQNFRVDDVTGNADEDLTIALPLAGPGNFGGAAGGIQKLGSGTLLLNGGNTYGGDTIVSEGSLVLGFQGMLNFVIGANGVNNKVTGPGTAEFQGIFTINLSGAEATNGNQWTLVNVATASYDDQDFYIRDFTSDGTGVHTLIQGVNTWTFNEATGILKVTSAVGNDYDTWATANSYWSMGAPNTAPAEDFDGDGLTNQQEYAFGLNPTSGRSANPITAPLNKATGTFSHTRRNPALTGLSYVYQYSANLAGWTAFTPAALTSDNGSPVEIVTATVPAAIRDTNPKLFVRVVAE